MCNLASFVTFYPCYRLSLTPVVSSIFTRFAESIHDTQEDLAAAGTAKALVFFLDDFMFWFEYVS
jgi:hypothetical protein